MIKDQADGIFWNLEQHIQKGQVVPNAIYVIGREQIQLNSSRLQQLIDEFGLKIVFSNPHEGSSTLKNHCYQYGVADLILSNKILLIGGGDMESGWPYLQYDNFLPKSLDYPENESAIARSPEIYTKTNKPYKFLFLNGRTRPHRKYLLERFRVTGLLDQSIWSWLDRTTGGSQEIQYIHNSEDLLNRQNEIKYLPAKYEVDRYHAQLNSPPPDNYIKHHLFDYIWGDVYLKAEPYVDTYFSLVTETVFEYPYSFRTEKIWKPIVMGHPWIVVANQGYYRDLHNLGFRTFGHVIDETFDQIENSQDRIERVAAVVEDLCQQDLAAFVNECHNVCKYNQQHLAEMRTKVRQKFPNRFFQFIKKYQFDE
jgi:hypothetical protein